MINPNDPAENEALAAQMHGGSGAPQRNNERPPHRARAPMDHGNALVEARKPQRFYLRTLGLLIFLYLHESRPHVLEQTDEAPSRPRHERRSSREDMDVRRSSDPPGRQAPSYDQPPARRAPGGPGGEVLTPF